jgi:sugar O-acyltransferase (sialic acid O-acetyltransferase NeuD family)
MSAKKLVIFGASNFVSDIFDAALATGLTPSKVVLHLPESRGERNIAISERISRLAKMGPRPEVQQLSQFEPGNDELYILGPTTPTRQALADEVVQRFHISFCSLIHPTAYVSPLAAVGQGVFIGAGSVIAPGARLGDHVVVNRGATIGHDTEIEDYSRVQPGATICSLTWIGRKVTVGAGATLIERLRIGDGAYISAGAVVIDDVQPWALMVGVPAKCTKTLPRQ